jgi:hypothetical protein
MDVMNQPSSQRAGEILSVHMIYDPCTSQIYTIMARTNAHKYTEIIHTTNPGVHCVYTLISVYLRAFVGTVIVYIKLCIYLTI